MVREDHISEVETRTGLAGELWNNLAAVRDALPELRLLMPEERLEPFRIRVQELAQRLEGCRGPLHLGIMGGTGAGKSTLINAIAKEMISSVSDRRPHTEKAVVYRHEDRANDVPFLEDFILKPHHTHHNRALKDLIIYDLPDYDSIRPEHRERVLAFLGELDLVLWVASPEKYADQAFYDLLAASPQARDNFLFIFNKIDLLLDEQGDYSPEREERVLDSFGKRLIEHGVEKPKLLALSALWAFENAHPEINTGFKELEDYLRRERREKEIQAIKLNNLEHELKTLYSGLSSQLEPEGLSRILGVLRVELDTEWTAIEEAAAQAARDVLHRKGPGWIEELLLSRHGDMAPVLAVIRLRLAWRRMASGEKREEGGPPQLSIPDHAVQSLADKIGFVRHRMVSELGAFGVPLDNRFLNEEGGREIEDLQAIGRDATTEFEAMVRTVAEAPKRIPFSFSRLSSLIWMALPPALMILYLMNPKNIQVILDTGAWSLVPKLFLTVIFTLFTSRGLSALCAMMILELILVPWLAGKRLKRLGAEAEVIQERLAVQYGKLASDRLRRTKEQYTAYLDSLRKALNRLEDFDR